MSEYNVVKSVFKSKKILVKSLEQIGYKPQVHKKASNLYGYQNDKRVQKAHIIIPRDQVGPASNDVGFEKVKDKYIMHISEYDQGANTFKDKELTQIYNEKVIMNEVNENGEYVINSRTVENDGTIRIKLNRV